MEDIQFDVDQSPVSKSDIWNIISAYFKERGLVRQQLDSFNAFIKHTLQDVVQNSTIDAEYDDKPAEGVKRVFFGL